MMYKCIRVYTVFLNVCVHIVYIYIYSIHMTYACLVGGFNPSEKY